MKLSTLISILALVLPLNGPVICQSSKSDKSKPKADTVRAKGFRADGGLLNVSEGEVECVCGGVPGKVTTHQLFENGDSVRVGNQGRAEILLEPGYYLRLANNSELHLLDLSPANLKLKLERGSAILEIEISEVSGPLDRLNTILTSALTILTPQDDYAIIRGGAYRFNVNADGGSELRVLKGLVVVSGSKVSDRMTATLRNGRVELTQASSNEDDSFDSWSRARAANLIEGNKLLRKLKWYKQIQSGETYFDVLDPEESAQANAAHTISAKSGLVTFVENGTAFKARGSGWQPLKADGSLRSGERVRTARQSRAEIRPYPDFNLFLSGDTEIVYSEQEDGAVSVELIKGSVAVSCTPDERVREHNTLTLVAAKQEYKISEMGTYRFNLPPEGQLTLLVYEGVVRLAGREIRATKGSGRSLVGETELSFNRQMQDSFDVWSRGTRQGFEIGKLRQHFSLGGLWFLNDATGEYTFVPKAWDYRSPYGGKYSSKYTVPNTFRRPRLLSGDEPPAGRINPTPRPAN